MQKQDIKECLQENYLPYAVSVITDRALPSIDGFKPSHRKLLYTMYKMGLTKGRRTKSANIVGQTMKLNPHGDASIYATMVRLTASNQALLTPLVDSKGNFGKIYSRDMSYAAARYTEAKLLPITQELFKGIDNNAINMVDNYDGTSKEPALLPTSFPSILANVNMGIAVSMASNICSFNLNELCDYTIDILSENKPKALIPDFPTGGYIVKDDSVFKNIDKKGRGSVKLRAKYRYDEDESCLEIYEIPYTTTIEAIVDKIVALVRTDKIKEIVDIRDETDLQGLKIAIDVKRNVDPDILMGKLFSMTSLEDSFGCNFNILIDGKPKVLGVNSIIKHWIEFRKGCLQRELQFDIDILKVERNKLKGLSVILTDLDKAISLIRSSKSEKEAINKLIKHFKLNNKQAEYIATIRLINMNNEWLANKTDTLNEVNKKLKAMVSNLDDSKHYTQTIIKQLKDIKEKYGQPRHTEIICGSEIEEVTEEDLIEDYNCQVVFTKEGYLKKTLRYSDTQFLKDGDEMKRQVQSTNKSKLLIFTSKANCYYLNMWEVKSTLPSNLGIYLPTHLGLEEEEEVLYVVTTEDFTGDMIFAFKNGKVARVDLISYETKTNRTRTVNAFNTKSEVVSVDYLEKGEEVKFITTSSVDKVVIFDSSQINSKKSSASQGVNVLRSREESTTATFQRLSDLGEIEDGIIDYYTVNIPAMGKFSRNDLNM